uniref:Uncharacterized protein n=1 Tax=Ciona intestinalis TaxID=7719 RepID=F6V944_CIOIN
METNNELKESYRCMVDSTVVNFIKSSVHFWEYK